MSYIGQRPVVGRYIKLDQISSGFNGSNTGFSMTAGSQAVFPGTARNLLLSLGGVIQEPDTDFTISGSTLTFTTAPVANTTFFGVIYGDMQSTGTPSDGTVLPASIATSGNFSFPQLTVTSDLTISSASPKIFLTDTNNNDDFEIRNDDGTFTIRNSTDGNDIISVASDNATTFTGAITASSTSTFLGGAVFNENGANVDFRVEGDTEANLLFVDAGEDKVGIGTGTPSGARLHILGSGNTGIKVQVGSSSADQIYLGNTGGASSVGTLTNVGFNLIQNGGVALAVNTSKNIGIGTTSPDQLLHINKSTGTTLFKASVAGNSTIGLEIVKTGSTTQSWRIADGQTVNGKLEFYDVTDSATRMCIDGSGNIGIGTTSPSTTLNVSGTSDGVLNLDTSDSRGAFVRFGQGGSFHNMVGCADGLITGLDKEDLGIRAKDKIGFTTNGDNIKMIILSGGNVGIGTTSPSSLLHTRTASVALASDGHVYIQSTDAGADIGGQLNFGNNNARRCAIAGRQESSDAIAGYLQFGTRGTSGDITERIRIDSSGRSLFNGTLGYANIPLSGNPANAAIHIRCTSKYNGIAFGEGAVSGAIGMGGADTTTAMVFVANAHPANLGGGVHDTFEWHSGTSGGGGPGKYMTLDTSGDLTLEDGDLVIGTSGHGIDFSATSGTGTSELFDDYEEGTWTATLGPASSEFTPTSNTNTCTYTKVGRQVTVVGIAKMTTPSNLNSYVNDNINHALKVSGLPFTIANAINGRSSATMGVGGDIQFPNGVLASHGSENSTSFAVFVNKSNGGTRTAPTINTSTQMNFHFSYTYFI